MEDLTNKVTLSKLRADEFIQPMAEIQKVITESGKTLTNADVNQLYKSIGATVATKALALAMELVDGKKVFITSPDGGEFTMRTGAAIGTYNDNSVLYAGTKFTNGDGSEGIERDYNGNILPAWFGALADGTTDDYTAITEAQAATLQDNSVEFAAGVCRIATTLTQTSPFKFLSRAIIKPDASVLISVKNKIEAGKWQIFDVSNSGVTVTLGAPSGTERSGQAVVYPEWWGANSNTQDTANVTLNTVAVNAACNYANQAHTIEFEGLYVVNDVVRYEQGTEFRGVIGRRLCGISFALTITSDTRCMSANTTANLCTFDGITLSLSSNSTIATASEVTILTLFRGRYIKVRNCEINSDFSASSVPLTEIIAIGAEPSLADPMYNSVIENNRMNGCDTDIFLKGSSTNIDLAMSGWTIYANECLGFTNREDGANIKLQFGTGISIWGNRFNNPGELVVAATHDGANQSADMIDSTKSFGTDQFKGGKITNVTDGSSGIITSNSATVVSATLAGGTDNDWDAGDIASIEYGGKAIILNDACANVGITDNYYEGGATGKQKIHVNDTASTIDIKEYMITDNEVVFNSNSEFNRSRFVNRFTWGLDSSTTPSIAGREGPFQFNPAGATTVTDFANGQDGQEITVKNQGPSTVTINDGGNFNLSANFAMGTNAVLVLFRSSGVWFEKSRSVN